MPYLLEKLQYGLRRRLRELATKSEAYALQIAAPDYYGFQPIQKAQAHSHIRLSIDETNIDAEHWGSHKIPLHIITHKLEFENFTSSQMLSVIFDGFLLSLSQLDFSDCVLDDKFIQTIVNAVNSPIQHIKFDACSFTENAAKMLFNAPAFRSLEEFSVKEPILPSTAWWIEAFAEANLTSLKEFSVHNAPPSILEIDKDVFFNFFKTQSDGFTLYLSFKTEENAAEQLLKNLFDEHFERRDEVRYTPKKKVVEIYFESLGRSVYYVLRSAYN